VLPGVSGGSVTISIHRDPETGAIAISGAGTAQVAFPGFSGTVTVAYADGVLTIQANGTFQRGNFTGTVEARVTNQPIDAEGNPLDAPPLPDFRASGAGQATIQFGRYLTGTAGITIREDGSITVTGEIALPPTVELFPASVYNRELFRAPEIRIPIVGFTVPVVNRSVGIFAFARGGVSFHASVGPGVLRDTRVGITFNPDQPEATHIAGQSRFEVPAEAGLTLSVTGGIGASIVIVEATGEVGLEAGLGLRALAGAEVGIDWTPSSGLALEAAVFAEARPKFDVGVVARVRVIFDTWVKTFELYDESWRRQLASFGPDIVLSVRFPARWSEAAGLDLDVNNIEVTYPEIDALEFGRSVFTELTG
jgi:hypothetical protein